MSTYPVAVPGEGELLVSVYEDLLLTGIVLVRLANHSPHGKIVQVHLIYRGQERKEMKRRS